MRVLVTGGAGFIGSHLVDRLLEEDNEVIVIDDLSSGKWENIQRHHDNILFRFVNKDLLKMDMESFFGLQSLIHGVDEVWHLAANADVRRGAEDTKIDIEQNNMVTYNVLEAMRQKGVKRMVFTSSSTIYGEAEDLPTREDYSPLEPISLYGASKTACEALISAYSHMFGIKSTVFRLANIIGPRGRGVVFDFIKKLKQKPEELEIHGDGLQDKSYVHIDDCIEAMLLGKSRQKKQYDVFNVGSSDSLSVKDIARMVSGIMKLKPKMRFTGGSGGWKGDVPRMRLDITKMRKLGWAPTYASWEAVVMTAEGVVR